MNKEVKTFTTVSDKEILVDTGNGMEPFEIRGVNREWEFLVILLRIMLLIRKPI